MNKAQILAMIRDAQDILNQAIPDDDVMTSGDLKQQHLLQRFMLLGQVLSMLESEERTKQFVPVAQAPLGAMAAVPSSGGAHAPTELEMEQAGAVHIIAEKLHADANEVRSVIFAMGMLACTDTLSTPEGGAKFRELIAKYPLAKRLTEVVRDTLAQA